jgi:glucose-1-phosphate cytidylyltransferase
MKAVILAGGFGTRLSEETGVRPKPMVEIGGRPIIWHIMKMYSTHGIDEFVIAAGYKSHLLKEYFASYFLRTADVTFDLRENSVTTHSASAEPWRVTVVETGDDTMTGGRIKRVAPYVGDETFCLTYGDCLARLDVGGLVAFHREQGAYATLTAIQPPGRFGALGLHPNEPRIESFHEKPSGDGGWVNGGFFVLEPDIFEYIEGDATVWEREPLEALARNGKLAAYRHEDYWQNMDSLRDKMVLEEQWGSGEPPWKVW